MIIIRFRRRKFFLKTNTSKKIKFALFISTIIFAIFTAIYTLDKVVTDTIIGNADAAARAKAAEIVNSAILKEYSNSFNYEELIKIEKDSSGNISMIRADTLKMNKIASEVALSVQKELKNMGSLGVDVKLSYGLKSTILSFFGPTIKVKMEPIGFIETKYLSDFQSAGINQTRHKIYVVVNTNIRVFIPLKNHQIEVKNEVPIAETIIVGKVPDTAINMDLSNAAFKLPNGQNSLK